MRMSEIFHLNALIPPALCAAVLLSQLVVIFASPAQADSVHFCEIFADEQWLRDHPPAAGKRGAEKNAGEPRTVRLLYFLPNDRPYRQAVVDSMKAVIKQVRTFYAEQMAAHGYGAMTFRYETDAVGEPVVHRVDGAHDNGHYGEGTSRKVSMEVREAYETLGNVFLIVVDRAGGLVSSDGRKLGGTGWYDETLISGYAFVPSGIHFWLAAHELAHAFGMGWHDFRDRAYIVAYGNSTYASGYNRLSACSAALLSVSPYFNPDIPVPAERLKLLTGPTVKLLSPVRYPAGAGSVSLRVNLESADGLNQVIFLVSRRQGALGSEVKACRILSGEKEAVVTFEYDGASPSEPGRTLSDPPSHGIGFRAIDRLGRAAFKNSSYRIVEGSPYLLATLEGHTDYVPALALSPDGATLASGSWDSTIRLWDTKTLEAIATLNEYRGEIVSLVFSPDGSMLASGSFDGGIALWDVASRELTGTLAGHEDWATSLAFSPDGATLVSGSWYDNNIRLWDVASRELTGTLAGHTSSIHSLVFSPVDSILASGSVDRTVRLWDVAARKEIATLALGRGGGPSVAFSPDGTILAVDVSGDGAIQLWDVAARRNVASHRQDHGGWINDLTFSPDGWNLASAGADGTLILRDAATGKIRKTFGHAGGVVTLAYWSDGSVLAAAVSGGPIIELWDTSEWVRRPVGVTVVSGREQTGLVDSTLAAPFVVVVRDQEGGPYADVAVTFAVARGEGMLSVTSAVTDTSGQAATTLTLGPLPGTNTVVARVADLEPATFTATARGNPDFDGNGVVGLSDFVTFAARFGLSQDDDGYDAQYDLDANGTIGFGDFVIFAGSFGKRA